MSDNSPYTITITVDEVPAAESKFMDILVTGVGYNITKVLTFERDFSDVNVTVTCVDRIPIDGNTCRTSARRSLRHSAEEIVVEFEFSSTSSRDPGLSRTLGTAGDFAILSKFGVTHIPGSTGTLSISGDVGCSPITHAALTGFSVTLDASTQFSTSIFVTGQLFGPDYGVPTPAKMTTAIYDMEAAYVDFAGRPYPDHVELQAGHLDGLTLSPGIYKWSTGIDVFSELTFEGSASDTWILQVSGVISTGSGARIILKGGARASNIIWQSTGNVAIGTYSHVEGIFLCATYIALKTGSSGNGAFLAQTAVTLDAVNIVKEPPEHTSS